MFTIELLPVAAFNLMWSSSPANKNSFAAVTATTAAAAGNSGSSNAMLVPPTLRQVPVPTTLLGPSVSAAEQQRRVLQERASTGWNQWWR